MVSEREVFRLQPFVGDILVTKRDKVSQTDVLQLRIVRTRAEHIDRFDSDVNKCFEHFEFINANDV